MDTVTQLQCSWCSFHAQLHILGLSTGGQGSRSNVITTNQAQKTSISYFLVLRKFIFQIFAGTPPLRTQKCMVRNHSMWSAACFPAELSLSVQLSLPFLLSFQVFPSEDPHLKEGRQVLVGVVFKFFIHLFRRQEDCEKQKQEEEVPKCKVTPQRLSATRMLKKRPRNSVQVSHLSWRDPDTWASIFCSQGCKPAFRSHNQRQNSNT